MQSEAYIIKKHMDARTVFAIQFVLITAGFSSLLKVSSEHFDELVYMTDFSNYYISYLMCYGIGVVSLLYNVLKSNYHVMDRNGRIVKWVFTAIFSLIITCSNYALLFLPVPKCEGSIFKSVYGLLYIIVVFTGSGCAFFNFFTALHNLFFLWNPSPLDRKKHVIVFFIVFAAVFFVDFGVLILCKYPGSLMTDSFAQIAQATGRSGYSNHHPFYHTILIKLLMNIGLIVFGKYNAAVATYSCFQILFISACFAYSVMFLYDLGAPNLMIIITTALFVLAPYNIMYSFSMTKDTMFGGFVLISVVSMYKLINNMGNRTISIFVMVISGIGVCLFRSNGLFVYVLWLVCNICLLRTELKKRFEIRKLLTYMTIVIIFAYIMKHPLLKVMNVPQTDFVESLSIPIQQIARTIVDNDELAFDELNLISKVLDTDMIREGYNHTTSDPIKERIRAKGNEDYLIQHKAEYLKLYLSIGFKHPGSYLAGWIDQTCGFWNSGYKYWHWYDWVGPGVDDNRYGIHRTIISNKFDTVFTEYLWLFEEVPILQLFLCMGFHTWIVLVCLYIAIIKKDCSGIIITLPLILILISLMIATPISMEFRYYYVTFCILPVIVPVILKNETNNVSIESLGENIIE